MLELMNCKQVIPQPISTAPKIQGHETVLVNAEYHGWIEARYFNGEWFALCDEYEPLINVTHWMPINTKFKF